MTPYTTIEAFAEDEFTEKRSRFLGAITPVATEKEAADFIAARRQAHYDARHTVFAYILREGNIQRCSDDGEPQGTGGVPVLEVLRHAGLVDVCVAVTRYFGGILLGTGGLTRAYSHGAAIAVAAAKRVTMCPTVVFSLRVEYPMFDAVTRLLASQGARQLGSEFAEAVTISARIAEEAYPAFCGALTEATNGTVSPVVTGREFAAL